MAAPNAVRAPFETVTAYLGWDHGRIDATLADAAVAVEESRFEQAARAYERFEHDLLRHERLEEELLFPVFEARSGIVGGPTAVMRDEHRQVRTALVLMRNGVAGHDPSAFRDGFRFFQAVMPDHNAKEEHILYPALDDLLSATERAALVARLERE
jgi:hemerythrin superfamily protein